MNISRQLLENVLFEFDWGQADPENAVVDPTTFDIPETAISSNDNYECLIARYLNWYVKCQELAATGTADILNSEPGLEFRNRILAAFQARMVRTDKDHPALLVYAHDCRVYQSKDCICMLPYCDL